MKILHASVRRLASAAGALALLSTAGTALGSTTLNAPLEITPKSKDFGVVGTQPGSSKQEFTIRNNADRRLTVQVSTSSPCVVIIPASRDIDPGKSATVTVSVRPEPGLCQATITVSGGGFGAAASGGRFSDTATVSAQVTNVSMSPPNVVFQKINIGQSSSQTVNVKNEGPATLNCQFTPGTFGTGTTGQANFTVAPASVSVGPNQQVPVTITFSAVSLQGLTNNGVSNPKFTIGLAAICGPVSSRPALVTGEFNLFRVAITPSASVAGGTVSAQVSGDQASAIGGGVKCAVVQDFNGGGNDGFSCSGLVTPGAQVTAIGGPAQSFKRWTGGTGSAAICNNSTAPSCTFSVTSDAVGLRTVL